MCSVLNEVDIKIHHYDRLMLINQISMQYRDNVRIPSYTSKNNIIKHLRLDVVRVIGPPTEMN